jgi:MFS family permease
VTSRAASNRRWSIVSVAVLFQIASLGVTLNCFTFFAQIWTKEFGVPMSRLAMAFTVMNFVVFFIVPLCGRLCDLMSVRKLVAAGVVLTAAFHAAMGFVGDAWHVIALYGLVLPICVSVNGLIPAQTLVSRWFSKGRGFAMGVTAFGVQLAGVIFPPIVVALIAGVGWRGTWWVFAAAIFVIVLPICWLVIRDRPPVQLGDEKPEADTMTTRLILARPNVWIMAASFVAVQIPLQAFAINLAPFLASRGVTGQSAAIIATLASVTAIGAKLLAGLASDRFGNRIPLIVTAAVAASGVLVLAFAQHFAMLALGYGLLGVCGAQWTLLSTTTAAEFPPSAFGRAYGLISMFTPLCALGPIVLASAQEHTGSYGPATIALAALAAVGAIVPLVYRQPKAPLGAPALA